jgi:glycosyltransferase 2 family protein
MAIKKKWLLLLLASIFLSLAVPLALGGLSQFKLLPRLSWEIAVLLAVMVVISWVFNALRTQFLLGFMGQRLGFREAALTTISAEFAGITTPGGVGMVATYAFLFNRLGVSLGKSAGLVGLIVLTDLAFYGTILPLAALIQLLTGAGQPRALRLVAIVVVVVAGAARLFWVAARHHRRFCSFLAQQMGKTPWLAQRRWRLGRGMVEFLQVLRLLGKMSWSQRLALYLITLDFWLPRYLILFMVLASLGQYVPVAYLVMTQGVLNLGGQVLAMPGGAGTVEGGYAALMRPYLSLEVIAFTLLVWRTYSYYCYLLVGGPIFLYKTGKAARDLLNRKV